MIDKTVRNASCESKFKYIDQVPAIRLPADKLTKNYELMCEGNTLLKQCADATGMDHKQFRSKLFKSPLMKINRDLRPLIKQEWKDASEETVELIARAVPYIKAVKNIEWDMIQQFSRLANRMAKKWCNRFVGIMNASEDYYQEALMGLLDAIYGYSRLDIKFITFAWMSIRNRLANANNKNNDLGPITNQALELLSQFEETKRVLNRYATDEEIYEIMDLSPKELKAITKAKVRCLNESSIEWEGEDGNRITDYTEIRMGIDKETDSVPCHYEIREAMKQANLSDLERKVVDIAMCPHYGWQTELAAETINPKTGQPYSRAAINVILEAALKKIKIAYQRVA